MLLKEIFRPSVVVHACNPSLHKNYWQEVLSEKPKAKKKKKQLKWWSMSSREHGPGFHPQHCNINTHTIYGCILVRPQGEVPGSPKFSSISIVHWSDMSS
jgi:hypothetical protein